MKSPTGFPARCKPFLHDGAVPLEDRPRNLVTDASVASAFNPKSRRNKEVSLVRVRSTRMSPLLLQRCGEPQRRTSDCEGSEGKVFDDVAQFLRREFHEINEKRKGDVVHCDEPDRQPEFLRQCLPQAADGKKREKVREARGNAKNDERHFARRVSDRTQVDYKPEMDEKRAGKR